MCNHIYCYFIFLVCIFQPSTREAISNTVEPEKVRCRDIGIMTSMESLDSSKSKWETKKPKGKTIGVNTDKVSQLTVALSTTVSSN